jgi:hypothetical protein
MKTISFKDWEATAEYTPLNKFMNCGNEIQVCSLDLPNNTKVIERTFMPWNFLKEPTSSYVVDLVLPVSMTDKVKEFNGRMAGEYYTDEGYGMPEFKDLENAFNFNQYYHEHLK